MKVDSDLIEGLPYQWEMPSEEAIDVEAEWVRKNPRYAANRLLTLKARMNGIEAALKAKLGDDLK